jgi:hypothetical protein
VNRSDEASFVAADVEHGQPTYLIGVRKYAAQFDEVRRIILF